MGFELNQYLMLSYEVTFSNTHTLLAQSDNTIQQSSTVEVQSNANLEPRTSVRHRLPILAHEPRVLQHQPKIFIISLHQSFRIAVPNCNPPKEICHQILPPPICLAPHSARNGDLAREVLVRARPTGVAAEEHYGVMQV